MEIPEKWRLPEKRDCMDTEYANKSLRYRTVVCGLGSPDKVDRQVFGFCEHGNEHLGYA